MKKLKTSFLIFAILLVAFVVAVEAIIYVSYNFLDISQIKLPPPQTEKIKLAFTPENRFAPFKEEISINTGKR
ncbi:MAG: hypothetical protein OXJ52_07585, partial [Oligoflexia bacterium]|nr:hypothetical protein [Oligoflexia bacterium]